MLEEAGFESAEQVAWTGYDTSAETLGASFRASRPEGAMRSRP